MSRTLPPVADRLVEAIAAQDIERTMEQLHPDGSFEDPTGRYEGADQLRSFFNGVFSIVRDVRWEVRDVAVDGERIAFEWTFSYEVRGGPAAGRRAEFPGVTLITLREGLVHRHRDYWDPRTPLEQLELDDFDGIAPSG